MNCRQIITNTFLLSLLAVITLYGCAAVGPDYVPPKMDMAEGWHTTPDPAILPEAELVRQWWTLYQDPMLNRLIETASQTNLDLLSAMARVEETRARLGIAEGDRYPAVEASVEVTRQRSSENSISTGYEKTFYDPGIGASWELDLFGRVRRSLEAATAEYQASEEDRTDVMISLYANIALTYLDIRTDQARLAAARANIQSQMEILDLTRSRFGHGLATDLDVSQAERLLARAEAEVPPLKISLSHGINNLAVLLGGRPGSLHEELMKTQPIPLPPPQATVGVPADLLRQRPDIRRAERLLAAQTARVGVATADLYPRFSLAGFFGYESIDTSDLFDAGSRVFSLGPSLRWSIFSGGRIRNQIKAQDAATRQALLAYERTVLNALREVENALRTYVEDRIRMAALERAVKAARRSVALSTDLYRQGLSDFQPVLDAQRDQFEFENQLASARGNSAANFARLYAALGGGWSPQETAENAESLKVSGDTFNDCR